MANYYTEYSFTLPVSPEEIDQFEKALSEAEPIHPVDATETEIRLRYDYRESKEDMVVYHQEGARGEPEDAALVVSKFLDLIGSDEAITFAYALRCGKPRPDAFGGGTIVVTRNGYHLESTDKRKRVLTQIADQEMMRVRAEIDVEADTPQEAAREAQRHLTPPTTADVYKVFGPLPTVVDLSENGEAKADQE